MDDFTDLYVAESLTRLQDADPLALWKKKGLYWELKKVPGQ